MFSVRAVLCSRRDKEIWAGIDLQPSALASDILPPPLLHSLFTFPYLVILKIETYSCVVKFSLVTQNNYELLIN